jgi:maltose alpha-D-glucosyltransferase/alpha-amylase
VRKSYPVFGRGTLSFIRPANRSVLVYLRQHQDKVIMCVANLSRSAQAAEIDMSEWRGRIPLELLGQKRFPPVGDGPYLVTLAPYGFFWFELCEARESESEAQSISPEFETLVVGEDWAPFERGHAHIALEQDVLPSFLASRRWFADKGRRRPATRLHALIPLDKGRPGMALALVDVTGMRESARYILPVGVKWTKLTADSPDLPRALAAVRRGPREGTLLDIAADTEFITQLLHNVIESRTIEAGDNRLEYRPTGKFQQLGLSEIDNVRPISADQSNTTALVGADYVVKVFRRTHDGVNPEVEIGRFLTDEVRFSNAPALYGSVELTSSGIRNSVAAVHQFVENQGDAWTVTNGYLDRFVEAQRLLTTDDPAASHEQESYLLRIAQIGRQVANLHVALASRNDIAGFAPERVSADDIGNWIGSVSTQAKDIFGELRRRRAELRTIEQELIAAVLDREAAFDAHLASLAPTSLDFLKIRHHGDLHLGQMLCVKDDIYILDFEGEPRRSIAERQRKFPAARDVAGVIRSIDYSATAALGRAKRLDPDEGGQLAVALDGWREGASRAFWEAYRANLIDDRLWPVDLAKSERLLDFFMLEKAIYEVGYELANRPEWVSVPLAGMSRILAGEPDQAVLQRGAPT